MHKTCSRYSAYLKQKGHSTADNYLTWGNNAADRAAKAKAGYVPQFQMLVMNSTDLLPAVTDDTLKEAQEAGSLLLCKKYSTQRDVLFQTLKKAKFHDLSLSGLLGRNIRQYVCMRLLRF